MESDRSPAIAGKKAAARYAAGLVEAGMRIGLGTGTTAEWLVRFLGERVRAESLAFAATSTSRRTAAIAAECGIDIAEMDAMGMLDLTIDGADEIDPDFNLVKGGGGALLREKIVAENSRRLVVIADESKRVQYLGAFPLPIEVVMFGQASTRRRIFECASDLGVSLRRMETRMAQGVPFVTDEGHHIFDAEFGRITVPGQLESELNNIPGVVENGLFVGMADTLVIGKSDGSVEIA